jgi:hypothetical protein
MDHECFRFSPDDPLVADLGPAGAAAISYVDRGYAVLPLAPGGKRPHSVLGEHGGVYRASTDRRDVVAWWRRHKTANVGVACGQVSRLIVFDLDVKSGEDGPAEFARQLGPWIPQQLVVRTPTGGRHIWLRTPAGLAVPGKQGLLPGVDVKGDGGYVVAAPSVLAVGGADRPGERSGGTVELPYSWESGCPCSPPELPDAEAVCGWAGAQPSRAAGAGLGGEPADLEKLERDGLENGSRNVSLYKAMCSAYRRYGTGAAGEQTVSGVLERIMAATVSRAGFSDREVAAVRSYARAFAARREDEDRQLASRWKESGRWGA